MLGLKIIAVGKLKDKYLHAAEDEYRKRLTRFCAPEIVELKDEPTPDNPTPRERDAVLAKEAERIEGALPQRASIYTLCVEGKEYSSEDFAELLEQDVNAGRSICFVIGGSLGMAESIKKQSRRISLSRMTFPHRLARIILLEQVFRAFKIMNNETYHK